MKREVLKLTKYEKFKDKIIETLARDGCVEGITKEEGKCILTNGERDCLKCTIKVLNEKA